MKSAKKNCLDIFALILLFGGTQRASGLYKVEVPNEDGSNLLVQNSKPNFAYIFVFPRSASSPGLGLAAHSLALEVRLRLADKANIIPFYLLSNHLLVGSATDGRTPFMQLNGKYIEGADLIFDTLVEMKRSQGEEEKAMKHQREEAKDSTNAGKTASTSNSKKNFAVLVEKMRNALSKEANMKKNEAERKKKEAEFMRHAQMLFWILLRDRLYEQGPRGESEGGLKFMVSDQSVIEELVPLLFAVKPIKEVPIIFGKKKSTIVNEEHSEGGDDDITEVVDDEEEEKRIAKGKAVADDKAAGPYGAKCLKDLAFWKAYFDVKGESSTEKYQFLQLHAHCLGDLLSKRASTSEIENADEEEVVWKRFDDQMSNLIYEELSNYFDNEEERMKTFLNGNKSVERVTKVLGIDIHRDKRRLSLLECSKEDIFELFKHSRGAIVKQLEIRYKQMERAKQTSQHQPTGQYATMGSLRLRPDLQPKVKPMNWPQPPHYLFGPEPSEADAFLFAVLLQYMEVGGLNMESLRKEFEMTSKQETMRLGNFVKQMREYLGWTDDNQVKMLLRPWPLMYEQEGIKFEREDKYNGPFSLKTDELEWLPDFSWDKHWEEKLAKISDRDSNKELFKFVYHRIDVHLRKEWGGYDGEEKFEKKGKTVKHLVASFLCGLEGNEEPGKKLGTVADECNGHHLVEMEQHLPNEREIKKVVYNAVVDFNKQLIEQSVVKTVERGVLGDPLLGDEH